MLFFPLLTLAVAVPMQFGPVTVCFKTKFDGNPFDFVQNDVRVRFIDKKGKVTERLAFYDGNNQWKAKLVTPAKGTYTAKLYRNFQPVSTAAQQIFVANQLEMRFIRLNDESKTRFMYDGGQPYYPIGFNLGWQHERTLTMGEQLAKMRQNGLNWTRIWASSWDGKNPWYPSPGEKLGTREMSLKAMRRWDSLVQACEKNRIAFQFVLFHHGSFSTHVNSNWKEHPWNRANGGFLDRPHAFFTDREAEARAFMWIRYAIARWADSPAIMAWELFNEVEWTDARYDEGWKNIARWHEKTSRYIRGNDPYKHLITTSSDLAGDGLYSRMDYYQPHVYATSVTNAIAGLLPPSDKPLFFGEFGSLNFDPKKNVNNLRDGIYSSVLSGHAGVAGYWPWDQVEEFNLYPEFKRVARIVRDSSIAHHFFAKPTPVRAISPICGDLKIVPGGGWSRSRVSKLNLPRDAQPAVLGGLPSYFQSKSGKNRSLFQNPLVLEFNAATPGKLILSCDQVSKNGAKIRLVLNSKSVLVHSLPGAKSDRDLQEKLRIDYPAGNNVIELHNDGPDWFRFESIVLTGAGDLYSALGLCDHGWFLGRFVASTLQKRPVPVTVTDLGIGDGKYDAVLYDLNTGLVENQPVKVRGGQLADFPMKPSDAVLLLRRRQATK